MKESIKYIPIFLLLLLLSAALSSSAALSISSEGLQPIHDQKNISIKPLIDPQPSAISININKIANISLGYVRDVFVSGSIAYVSVLLDGSNILKIINISDPSAPLEIGSLDIAGNFNDIFISGSYAYILQRDFGLKIVDITVPTAPVQVGYFEDEAEDLYSLFVVGMYAYIALGTEGLRLLDVSNPAAPVQVSCFNDGGQVMDVFVSGSYAYTADYGDGFEIIDISNPAIPNKVGQRFRFDGYMTGVHVSGLYAYIEEWGAGVEIVDVSDPTNPVSISLLNCLGNARDIDFSEKCVFVAEEDKGFEIFDVSDPATPVQIGQFDDGGSAKKICVSGSFAYVADGDDGLEIFQFVKQPLTINITSPLNSPSWVRERSYNITWSTTHNNSAVSIELFKNGASLRLLSLEVPSIDGQYLWMIPADLETSSEYQIKITDMSNPTVYSISALFRISGSLALPHTLVFLFGVLGGLLGVGVLLKRKYKSN